MFSLLRAWVQSLVGELRSHKPHGAAKKKILTVCETMIGASKTVATCTSQVAQGNSSMRNPIKREEDNSITGAFISTVEELHSSPSSCVVHTLYRFFVAF